MKIRKIFHLYEIVEELNVYSDGYCLILFGLLYGDFGGNLTVKDIKFQIGFFCWKVDMGLIVSSY